MQTVENPPGIDSSVAGRVVQMNEILVEMVNTLQFPAHANRPGHRRAADLQHVLNFIQQFNRLTAIPIQLVDEGENRGIAQPADFHQLDGALLDAPGAVNHHQRRIHRSQGAVGVFGKIFVGREYRAD
jgi:hypothetical protein